MDDKTTKYSIRSFLSRNNTSSTKMNEVTVDSTKRQLSSGSRELSNDPKKSKSISLNETANESVDVFNEAPAWAVAL